MSFGFRYRAHYTSRPDVPSHRKLYAWIKGAVSVYYIHGGNIIKNFAKIAVLAAALWAPRVGAQSVYTASDFISAWNAGSGSITAVGAPVNAAGDYGITFPSGQNPLNALSSGISISGYGGAPFGTALTLNGATLAFAPNWNDGISVSLSGLSIYGASNGAVSLIGNGVGAHSLSIDGVFFYGNNSSGNGGAVNVQSQVQSTQPSDYILTGNNFSTNAAGSGGAVYMVSNNALFNNPGVPLQFEVAAGPGAGYITYNRADAGDGGGIYFMGNNAGGGASGSLFTASGYTFYANYASSLGGAIYNGVLNGNAPAANDFVITGSTFANNQSGNGGGAVATSINGGSTDVGVSIDGKFYSNSAANGGGAIYNAVGDQYSPYGGSITFDLSNPANIFNGNKATDGGAIYNYIMPGQSNVVVNLGGQFTGNTAIGRGGALYNTSGNNYPGTSVVNVAEGTLFYGNGAAYGGAIYNDGNGVINFNTGSSDIVFLNNYSSGAANGPGIYQGSSTAVMNIAGTGTMDVNDGIAGIGTLNQHAGTNFNLTGSSQSTGFTGIYNNAAGSAINVDGLMFGGQNNFHGVGNINSSQNSFYFNANMFSNSQMNFTSLSTGRVSIGQAANSMSAGINFLGDGATIGFNAISGGSASYLLQNDISNGQSNAIIFNNSDITFGAASYMGGTGYDFYNNSVLDLANSSPAYRQYNFANLSADSSVLLSFKIGNNQGSLMSDAISVANGGGTIGLGLVYVNDADGLITGTQQVIYGSPLAFANGETQYVATSLGTYSITTENDYYVNFSGLGGAGGSGNTTVSTDPGTGGTTTTTNDPGAGSTTTTTTDPGGGSTTTITGGGGGDTTITTGPDGSTTITGGDGGSGGSTTIPPGSSGSTTAGDGSTIDVSTDPSTGNTTTTITQPGGGGSTTIVTAPNGSTTVYNPDGSTASTTVGPGGNATASTTTTLALDDVNMMDAAAAAVFGTAAPASRAFQIGSNEVYKNASSLHDMAVGNFSVHGANVGTKTSVLSGVNISSPGTEQSLFNITTDGTYFTLQDLTIQDSYSAAGGSVINMDSANSTATLVNLLVQNNSSIGNGGAANITAGNVSSTNIDYINNSATGDGGAIYNSGNITKHGGTFIGNTAGGNGGVFYNDSTDPSNPTTVYSGTSDMVFANNAAGGLGGAIYNAGFMDISVALGANMIFSGNTAGGAANDIYNAGTITFTSTGGSLVINGGIAGTADALIAKHSPATFVLAPTADNSGYLGTFQQTNGIVEAYGRFFGGTNIMESGILNWHAGATKEDTATLAASGGTINVYGTLRLGNALDVVSPYATLTLQGGSLVDVAGGTIFIGPHDTFLWPDGTYGASQMSDGHIVFEGQGLSVYSGGYRQTGGVIHFQNSASVHISDNAPGGGITGGDVAISNASVFVRGVDLDIGPGGAPSPAGQSLFMAFAAPLPAIPTTGSLAMGDNALLSMVDGALQTHKMAGDFALYAILDNTDMTTVDFAVDVDARLGASDIVVFGGDVAAPGTTVILGNGQPSADPGYISDITAIGGAVVLSGINLINAPIDPVVPFRIMEAAAFDPNVMFATSIQEYDTPLGAYSVSSLGEGMYELRLESISPVAMRGAVSGLLNYQGQGLMAGSVFDRLYVDGITERLPEDRCDCFLDGYKFDPGVRFGEGRWATAYGLSEKRRFTEGISADGSSFGAAAGYDFRPSRFRGGLEFMPGVFLAYTGNFYDYGGLDIRQNGLSAGAMGSLGYGGWLASAMAFGGLYENATMIGGEGDRDTNDFFGGAARGAYNFSLGRFVGGPSLTAIWASYARQSWHSSYGDMDISADRFDGTTLIPAIGLTYLGERGWSTRANVAYVENYVPVVAGTAGNIALPGVGFKGGYLECALGVARELENSRVSFDLIGLSGEGAQGLGAKIGFVLRSLP